jgi:hypothetical protein
MANAATDVVDALALPGKLNAENFVINVEAIKREHFAGEARAMAKALGLAGSSPKNWLVRRSRPTWASLVDLCYRLDVPPAQLASTETILTHPTFWRAVPAKALDKPHVHLSPKKLRRIEFSLLQLIARGEAADERGNQPLPRIAKTLDTSTSMLKRHFPKECAILVRLRRARQSESARLNEAKRAERIAGAVQMTISQKKPPTVRNLKRTGLVRASDVITRKRSR